MTSPAGDPLQIRTEARRQPQEMQRRTRGVLLALLAITVAGALGYFAMQRPELVEELLTTAGIAEDPRIEERWQAAEALRADPNQSLTAIVAAYNRVLEIGVHEGAQNAIAEAATQWKADIQTALDNADFGLAEVKLNESFGLFQDDAELTTLFESLANRRRAATLLEDARLLVERQGLENDTTATAAIQAYQEVIRLHPDNAEARAQLDRLAEHYATQAAAAARSGDVTIAMNNLGRAATANPEFAGLEIVREEIRNATTLQVEIDTMLQQASALRGEGMLIDPPESNAAEIYHRVLATDPDNVIASQGLSEVGAQVMGRFAEYIEARQFDEVVQLVDRSVAVGLGDQPVSEMKARLESEIARFARVDELIEDAESLMVQGFITEPVDGSAVGRLREVLRLEPNNETAQAYLVESAERLASVAREAHDVGMLDDARHYLELALTVRPDVDEWRRLRAEWTTSEAGQ